MRTFLILILLLPAAHYGFTQNKYEKEIRVKDKDVPIEALRFVDTLAFTKKVKWFKEIGLDKNSYEAKTKKEGRWYSIEFSADGTFEDIEIVIDSEEIPDEIQKKIFTYLNEKYDKYTIEKIQIQYSGSHTLNYFLNRGPVVDLKIQYEIVLSSKLDGSFVMFEALFDADGAFLNSARIVLDRLDNIEY
jgi:hypothetical protein